MHSNAFILILGLFAAANAFNCDVSEISCAILYGENKCGGETVPVVDKGEWTKPAANAAGIKTFHSAVVEADCMLVTYSGPNKKGNRRVYYGNVDKDVYYSLETERHGSFRTAECFCKAYDIVLTPPTIKAQPSKNEHSVKLFYDKDQIGDAVKLDFDGANVCLPLEGCDKRANRKIRSMSVNSIPGSCICFNEKADCSGSTLCYKDGQFSNDLDTRLNGVQSISAFNHQCRFDFHTHNYTGHTKQTTPC